MLNDIEILLGLCSFYGSSYYWSSSANDTGLRLLTWALARQDGMIGHYNGMKLYGELPIYSYLPRALEILRELETNGMLTEAIGGFTVKRWTDKGEVLFHSIMGRHLIHWSGHVKLVPKMLCRRPDYWPTGLFIYPGLTYWAIPKDEGPMECSEYGVHCYNNVIQALAMDHLNGDLFDDFQELVLLAVTPLGRTTHSGIKTCSEGLRVDGVISTHFRTPEDPLIRLFLRHTLQQPRLTDARSIREFYQRRYDPNTMSMFEPSSLQNRQYPLIGPGWDRFVLASMLDYPL